LCIPQFHLADLCGSNFQAVTDVFGTPVLHIDVGLGENEKKLIRDMAVSASEMLGASCAKNVKTFAYEDRIPGYGIHEMGVATSAFQNVGHREAALINYTPG
jgi:hypothetical protein